MAYKKKPRTVSAAIALADRLFTPEAAADFLGISPQTLAHWRVRGSGPKYVHLSKRCIRYSELVLRQWVESRTHDSTTEAQSAE